MPVLVASHSPYAALLAAALVTATTLVWRAGRRRGFDDRAWLACTAAWLTGGIGGSAALAAAVGMAGGRTLVGGVAGSLLALWAAARAVRIPPAHALDTLGVAVPVGAAIARVGCFLAGCCAGTPTTLPLAVRYGPGTAAYDGQREAGLIGSGADHALDAHPVQLYDAALSLLLAAALSRPAARRLGAGARATLMVAGMAAIRLTTQWLRLSHGDAAPLDRVQWAMLAVLAGCALLWSRRAAFAGATRPSRSPAHVGAVAIATLLVAVAVARVVSPVEAIALALASAAAVGAALRLTTVPLRGALPVVPVLFLQQLPGDTPRTPRLQVDVGVAGAAYEGVGYGTDPGSDCEPPRQVVEYTRRHTVQMAGVGIAYTTADASGERFTLRAHAAAGTDRAQAARVERNAPADAAPHSTAISAASLALEVDRNRFGFVFGGAEVSRPGSADEYPGPDHVILAGLRVGPRVGPSLVGGLNASPLVPGLPPVRYAGLAVASREGDRVVLGFGELGLFAQARIWPADRRLGVSGFLGAMDDHRWYGGIGASYRAFAPSSAAP